MKLGLFCFQLKVDLFCAVNLEFVTYRTLHSQKSFDCPVDVDALFAHWLTAKLSFYRLAALELTRQWHAQVDAPLTALSGSDALAFGAAFYSPDHPFYARPFLYQDEWRLPRKTTLERGWAALCFADQPDCLDWMAKAAARAGVYSRFETVLQAPLLGRPGVYAVNCFADCTSPIGSSSRGASPRV
jgi:hypothetical protein